MTAKIQILVYILDDNLNDLRQMERVLSNTDTFNIKTFYYPQEFLAAITDDVYMIITDVSITDYNVFDTIVNIKKKHPGIYIIVVSGYFDVKILMRLINECHIWGIADKNESRWPENLREIVELTVPKMLDKKMALANV